MSVANGTRQRWTEADIPDQGARTVVVTGANTGLGFETARALARRGATVVLACRDLDKATLAAARIGTGAVRTLRLDLASLDSVREAAGELRSRYGRLDLLINNAGLMMPPYGRTADGFELQFGTNHLGHFALTGLVLDLLLAAPGSRIVMVSSMGHRMGVMDFEDLQFERGYNRIASYGRSKLANLLFTYELQRRLDEAGAGTIAVAAHPGTSRTELGRHQTGAMGVPGAARTHAWVRCRHCAPPSTRASAAESTTAPTGSSRCTDTRSASRPTLARTTPRSSAACGRSPSA
jgi:NAD(P)-dependent dehydrogenase (short-subunit alcohol dehydrogenase family)